MKTKALMVGLLALFVSVPGMAQPVPGEGALTLEELFSTSTFFGERFGPARWLEGGRGYTTLEAPANRQGHDIVRYDPETGAREVLVPAWRLIPPNRATPLDIHDYHWSPDGQKLLVFTDRKSVV